MTTKVAPPGWKPDPDWKPTEEWLARKPERPFAEPDFGLGEQSRHGDHNQKSHGRRGPGGEMSKARLERTAEFRALAEGYGYGNLESTTIGADNEPGFIMTREDGVGGAQVIVVTDAFAAAPCGEESLRAWDEAQGSLYGIPAPPGQLTVLHLGDRDAFSEEFTNPDGSVTKMVDTAGGVTAYMRDGTNHVAVNPGFIDPNSPLYRLAKDSPGADGKPIDPNYMPFAESWHGRTTRDLPDVDASVRHTVIHEYGHVVDNQTGGGLSTAFMADTMIAVALSSGSPEKAAEVAGRGPTPQQLLDVGVSGYGCVDGPAEAWADAFADAVLFGGEETTPASVATNVIIRDARNSSMNAMAEAQGFGND